MISKYVFFFEQNNTYLLFNSKNNSFLELTKDLYEELLIIKNDGESSLFDDEEIVNKLLDSGILTTEFDDKAFLDDIIFKHNLLFYSKETMGLTLAPTIACNLKCPYCFEVSKPRGVITNEICDKIIDFIKRNQKNEYLNLNWFGGEPLLAFNQIEYFLDSLKENGIELSSHSIVTNATLLKGKVLDIFEKYPLTNIQVTFDGIKERHDKLRVYYNGQGTFCEILNNMDEFIVRNPKTYISIRVNMGKHNSNDFFELKETLTQRYPNNKNIFIYPGILKGDNDCGYMSNFFSPKELSNFYTSLQNKDEEVKIPSYTNKGCVANFINSYVIGPHGEVYKCWADMGIREREIGSVIDDKFRNSNLFKQYMIHGSFVDDKNCHDCGLLSICSGGCSRSRIENKFEGKNNNLCDHYILEGGQSLKKMLYLYYKQHYR